MANTIYGTDNSETINGTSADDTIYGKGGNDIIVDDRGDDWLLGGAGNDTLTGGRGTNDYWGGAGYDIIKTVTRVGASYSDDLVHDFTQGADKIDVSAWGISDIGQIQDLLYTDSHNDAAFNAFYNGVDHVMRLAGVDPGALTSSDFTFSTAAGSTQTGTANDDVLFGSAQNDRLNGGSGDDLLLGGAGNDVLVGGFGLDNYDGGTGFDFVSYAYSSDEGVHVNLAAGTTTFSDGATEYLKSIEAVAGSQVDDVLVGTGGYNILQGLGGNDRLTGGGGHDRLTGGTGDDVFVYNRAADSNDKTGLDLITDFTSGQDTIDLVGLENNSGQDLHFIGTAPFSHHAGELHYAVSGGNTIVSADIDGNGAADFIVVLAGTHALTASDFVL